ncbi:MAG: DUF5119 domain-containing protein [Alistipes sp.]
MKPRALILLLGLALLCTACHRDHLYYATNECAVVRINVDWNPSHLQPNGVSAYAFDHQTGRAVGQCVISGNPNSVDVALPIGTYDIVIHNDTDEELDNIDLVGLDNLSTFQALISTNSESRYKLGEQRVGTRYATGCDVMATKLIQGIEIHSEDVQYFYNRPLPEDYEIAIEKTVAPARITELIDIKITVNNLTSAAGAPRSLLSDMSRGYDVGLSAKRSDLLTFEFVLNNKVIDPVNHKRGTITKQLISFGPPAVKSAEANYRLVMNFVLVNDTTYPVTLDVNNSITTEFDGLQYVHKIRAEITLPETIGNGEGPFNPDVEEWEDVEIGLPA